MSEKKRVSVNEVLSDFLRGLEDTELMRKYCLSSKQLQEVYRRLVETGRLTQEEVDTRKGLDDDVLEFEDDFSEDSPLTGASKDLAETDPRPLTSSSSSFHTLPAPPNNWQKKAYLGIIGGLVTALVGGIALSMTMPGGWERLFRILGSLMGLTGWGLQIWGCYYLVKGKGYHGALSILGALSCLGLIIVLDLPNKYARPKTSGDLIGLVVGLAIAAVFLGIILAIAVPYYFSFKRTSCDHAASANVLELAGAFEYLKKELADRNLKLDNDAINRGVEGNALQYMIGPYYGFHGCTGKCGVLIRINRYEDKWVIEGTALKGSRPSGTTSRYVYRSYVTAGGELPAIIMKGVLNAQNGKSREWNTYPYAPPGQPQICYTESIIKEEEPPGRGTFSIRIPNGIPCGKLRQE